MNEGREYDGAEGLGAQESGEEQADTSIDTLTETELEFVEQYVAADLPTDRQTIDANVRRNLKEFGPAGVDMKQVIQAVQSESVE
jgi:hypothetical protein